MDLAGLLAPVAGEFDVEEALECWRWLVPQRVRFLVVTATGDLFLVDTDGAVLFLDTVAGACQKVAASVGEWESKLQDPELFDHWFMPDLVEQLRENVPLCQGECYSAKHSPALGGSFMPANWEPTHWRVHFAFCGRLHETIKDLPPGTVITGVHFTPL